MISLGKQGTLHARRRAFALLRDKKVVKRLFDEIAPKFKDREGGYTRVYKLGWRQGDAAPLSLVELVSYAPPEEKKKSAIKKALDKVTPGKKGKAEKKVKEKGKEEKERKEGKEKKEKKVKKEEKEAPKEKKEKAKKKSKEESK